MHLLAATHRRVTISNPDSLLTQAAKSKVCQHLGFGQIPLRDPDSIRYPSPPLETGILTLTAAPSQLVVNTLHGYAPRVGTEVFKSMQWVKARNRLLEEVENCLTHDLFNVSLISSKNNESISCHCFELLDILLEGIWSKSFVWWSTHRSTIM